MVEFRKCDLQDLKQTDEVAKSLASSLEKLDGLVLNAGLGVGVYEETKDGIDSHMQVNHVSQQHLALTLLPLLLRTPNSRLVLQSSEFHRFAPDKTAFASVEELNTDIGPSNLYARTKLANIVFSRALLRRLQRGELGADPERLKVSGPWINATHPGGVVTDQQDQAVEAYGTLGKIGVKAVRPLMKDPVDEGCRPILWATTSNEIVENAVQGKYVRVLDLPRSFLMREADSMLTMCFRNRSSPTRKFKMARNRHSMRN